MTVKETLDQIMSLNRRIDLMLEQVMRLRSSVTSGTSKMTGMPRNQNVQDHIGNCVAACCELEAKINQNIDKLVTLRNGAMDMICNLGNSIQEEILELRYIGGFSWDEIASKTFCSRSKVFRLHHDALVRLEDMKKDINAD